MPSTDPDVLAVVVNHNAGATLAECLGALAGSTAPARVVVVDNASTDGSLGLVPRHHPFEVVVRNDRNLGFARANNQALAGAAADYYALVNPDCVVGADTLAVMVREMERDPEIGLASCVIRNPDGSVQRTCRRRLPTPLSSLARVTGLSRLGGSRPRLADFDYGDDPLPADTERVEAVSGAFMVARAAAVAEVGLLDEGYFLHCEDLDWCKRFADHGYGVAFVPHTEVVHAGGVSGRGLAVTWHLHRGMLRFYRKHYRGRYPVVLLPLVYGGVLASFGVRAAAILARGAAARWRAARG